MTAPPEAAEDRNYFVADAKQKEVTQPRQTATSKAPAQTPSPAATAAPTRIWKKNQLSVEVSVVPPDFTLPDDRAGVQKAALDMYDLVFQKSKLGPLLLQDIAAFPTGVLDPPQGPLSAEDRKTLPKVTSIKVSLLPPDPNDSEKGAYHGQECDRLPLTGLTALPKCDDLPVAKGREFHVQRHR